MYHAIPVISTDSEVSRWQLLSSKDSSKLMKANSVIELIQQATSGTFLKPLFRLPLLTVNFVDLLNKWRTILEELKESRISDSLVNLVIIGFLTQFKYVNRPNYILNKKELLSLCLPLEIKDLNFTRHISRAIVEEGTFILGDKSFHGLLMTVYYVFTLPVSEFGNAYKLFNDKFNSTMNFISNILGEGEEDYVEHVEWTTFFSALEDTGPIGIFVRKNKQLKRNKKQPMTLIDGASELSYVTPVYIDFSKIKFDKYQNILHNLSPHDLGSLTKINQLQGTVFDLITDLLIDQNQLSDDLTKWYKLSVSQRSRSGTRSFSTTTPSSPARSARPTHWTQLRRRPYAGLTAELPKEADSFMERVQRANVEGDIVYEEDDD
jgi:hypothetical protein